MAEISLYATDGQELIIEARHVTKVFKTPLDVCTVVRYRTKEGERAIRAEGSYDEVFGEIREARRDS